MIPIRWLALLGMGLVSSLALVTSAEAKEPPAGHAGPGPASLGPQPKGRDHGPMAMPKEKRKQPAVAMDAPAMGPKEPPGSPPGLHGGPPGMMGAGPAQPTPDFRRADRRPKDAAMQGRWLEQRKDRLKRRRARMQEFKQVCGEEDLKKPQIQAMIRVHTWRMARLRRVQELADAENNTEMSQKVEKLRQKELLHFNHLMRSCRTGGEVDGGVPPQTSATTAAPAELPDKKEGKPGVAKTEGAK